MMQLADFDRVVIEASEYARGHHSYAVYACGQLKAIKLGEFLNKSKAFNLFYIHAPYTYGAIVGGRNEKRLLLWMNAK